MLKSVFKKGTVISILLIMFVFCLVLQGFTDEKSSTISGQITDSDDQPIADISVVLIYVTVDENGINPKYSSEYYPFLVQLPLLPSENNEKPPDKDELHKYPPYIEIRTNSNGEFAFRNIAEGNFQLIVLPKLPPGNDMQKPVPGNPGDFAYPEIQYVKFGEISFYPQLFAFFPLLGAVTLGVAPGINVENIELRVNMENSRSFRGRIVYQDGSPLADTNLRIIIGKLNIDEDIDPHSRMSVPKETDEDGNFVVSFNNITGIYAISVNYHGLTAISPPFIFNDEIPLEKTNLTLNGNRSEIVELQTDNEAAFFTKIIDATPWIINPINGHIYKRITCESRDDAVTKAAKENAYLVTITNEAEQIWLESVFGSDSYWIGLTDVEKEGKWKWDSGEKMRYTNWIKYEDTSNNTPSILRFFGFKNKKEKREREKNDFAIMKVDGSYMKWKPVSYEYSEKGNIKIAVIEKSQNRK